jgi:acyl-CoA synthetase (AMP-forming)/AMP-acid ligase II
MNPSRPATVDPAKIVQAIQQNEITNSFGSPALWTKIARYCEANSITLPTVRRVLMAGAPVSPTLMEQMRGIIPNGEIHTPYGATEALPVSSISASEVLESTAQRTQKGEGTCVGKALPGVSVRIIEPVDGVIASIDQIVEMPAGAIGEIIVQGPSVTCGYDQLAEADAQSKISAGDSHWHRMGDMGWLDDTGRLWFCGRKVERVLSVNGPMYTDCCEAIFNQHPEVFRSALVDLGGGVPGIVIEPERNSEVEAADFVASLKTLASEHALTASIEHFFFEESFPVDVRHNAKIHRLSLARKFALK